MQRIFIISEPGYRRAPVAKFVTYGVLIALKCIAEVNWMEAACCIIVQVLIRQNKLRVLIAIRQYMRLSHLSWRQHRRKRGRWWQGYVLRER